MDRRSTSTIRDAYSIYGNAQIEAYRSINVSHIRLDSSDIMKHSSNVTQTGGTSDSAMNLHSPLPC